jgi:hypothetical protein
MRFRDSKGFNRIFSRLIAAVAIIATVFVVSTSGAVISKNAGHHCDDQDHCPICTLVLQCQQNIKTIGSGLIIAAVAALVFTVMATAAVKYEYQSVQTTLVSQKVRLDS